MEKKRLKHKTIWIITAACIIILALFLFWQNNGLTVSPHTYFSEKLPQAFDGFCIVHISDLHNKSFGNDQKRLLALVEQQQPDLILITGDLVDSRRYDLQPALQLMQGAVSLAPVFYVSGNHELASGHWEEVKHAAQSCGVQVLDDTFTSIVSGGESIQLIGLQNDSGSSWQENDPSNENTVLSQITALTGSTSFRILLAHHPELFLTYCDSGADMVLSGHAHGGQIRLPGIGGLYAPNQGFFPAYTSGAYSKDGTTMFVSRGLGNSLFPFRIWNRPEIVTITLRRGTDTGG